MHELGFAQPRYCLQPTVRRRLRQRRPRLGGELRERRRGVAKPQLGDLDEVGRQGVEAERADRLELPVRGSGDAFEVRLVGVREPVRVCSQTRRGWRALRGPSAVSPAPASASTAPIASCPFAYTSAWLRRSATASSRPPGAATSWMNRGASSVAGRGSRGAGRAGRTASRRRAARRAGTRRGSRSVRPRASAAPRAARPSGEHAGLPQHRERLRVDRDVQLVPGRLLERALSVGADLRADAEIAEERERAARDGRRR